MLTMCLRLRGFWFDSRSGRYQVVSIWMGDYLRTGKPSSYVATSQPPGSTQPFMR